MENITTSLKGDILTIEIDLGKRGAKSASGKSVVIASTGGNIPVLHPKMEGIKIGINCYTPVPK